MMKPTGRVFLKSEFGPISDRWPCFSFTRSVVGTRLQREYRPGRDIILYAGTTDPKTTEDPDHRSRLISAVSVEPSQILATREIVPADQWRETVARFGPDAWPYAMAVIDAALTMGPPFPDARAVTPTAYTSLGAMEYRGNIVEVTGTERDAVMALPAERIELHLTEPVRRYMELKGALSRTVDKTVKQEATRLALLIADRVKAGGTTSTRLNPVRSAPNVSDLVTILIRKWTVDQKGMCALCGAPLLATTHNKMLQVSADRIDSSNTAYDDANTHVTHLACNWAKNEYGVDAFADWLKTLRQVATQDIKSGA